MDLSTVFRQESDLEKRREPFKDVPWALKFFDDPSLRPFANNSRDLKIDSRTDTFVGKTLATDDTIKAWQSFYRAPDTAFGNGEVLSLLSLGSGVNGHTDTCHGGFVSLLLDEALGLSAQNFRPKDKKTMTAYLNVNYKKPVTTPSVVLCRASVDRVEGRKLYVKGSIEDGNGTVLSTAEALFIVLDSISLSGKL
ncbi:thioesterase family protein-like protein [Bisporella sp. PMI_857]|nr:thioesterase family protein-like protein [Bisporella sp. PMI_857]